MTPTARVLNIIRFVCGVATSRNALQTLMFTLSHTNHMYMCGIEHS